MSRKHCLLYLTCADRAEAEKIGDALLEQRLVACVKFSSTEVQYWWQGKLERAEEVLLIMESAEDLFARVEAEVAKHHSYDTFVLTAVSIVRSSAQAASWLGQELTAGD